MYVCMCMYIYIYGFPFSGGGVKHCLLAEIGASFWKFGEACKPGAKVFGPCRMALGKTKEAQETPQKPPRHPKGNSTETKKTLLVCGEAKGHSKERKHCPYWLGGLSEYWSTPLGPWGSLFVRKGELEAPSN